MSTPEGLVKQQIKKELDLRKDMYYNMPVPMGYGTPMLDFVGAYNKLFFAIEAKVPGQHPTPRQKETIRTMRLGGAAVFVVDCGKNYPIQPLIDWLDENARKNSSEPQAQSALRPTNAINR